MVNRWSQHSLSELDTCHPRLRRLAYRVLSIYDHRIVQGARSREEQAEYIARGVSKLTNPLESKHVVRAGLRPFSEALDFIPTPNGRIHEDVYEKVGPFYLIAGAYRMAARELQIPIRLGADWDGDGSTRDQSFHDLGHVELL